MLNITNQNGVTYDVDYTCRLTDMNGRSEDCRSYDYQNMNGITREDDICLSMTHMNPDILRHRYADPCTG